MKNVPTNLSNFNIKVGKLDVDKLVPALVDLSKLTDVVKNDVVKKDVHDAKIKNIEDKICDITNLATNPSVNAKLNEIKGEIHNITNLATTTALTAVQSKMPNVSEVFRKTDYNTKINEIENKIDTDHDHDKYITAQEFNELTSENVTARLKQVDLASKSDKVKFLKKTDFDNKLKDDTSNKMN